MKPSYDDYVLPVPAEFWAEVKLILDANVGTMKPVPMDEIYTLCEKYLPGLF